MLPFRMYSERSCSFWSFFSNQTHRNQFLIFSSILFKLPSSLDTYIQAIFFYEESNDIYAIVMITFNCSNDQNKHLYTYKNNLQTGSTVFLLISADFPIWGRDVKNLENSKIGKQQKCLIFIRESSYEQSNGAILSDFSLFFGRNHTTCVELFLTTSGMFNKH